MPGAQRVIEYHLVARGECWGHALGQEPLRLREGDLIVFPQGDPHVLSSAPGMRAEPDLSIFARPRSTPLPLVFERGGGGPERTHLVCGFLGCDERPYNPLLAALPHVIHLPAGRRPQTPGWLGTLVTIAVAESGSARAGGENVLARLSELMFVEVVRRYLETLPPAAERLARRAARPGRRAGARRAARRRPPSPGRSRGWRGSSAPRAPSFAERFTEMVGQPPMQYLALWRMQLAAPPARRGPVRWPRWPTRSVTNRKPRSAGRSRSWWARLRRPGAGGSGFRAGPPPCYSGGLWPSSTISS